MMLTYNTRKKIIHYLRLFKLPVYRELKEFFIHYLGGLYKRTDEHHIFLLGGGLTFSLLSCIIPIVLIVFAILGNVLEVTSVEEQVNTFIQTMIPYSEYANYAREVIFSRIQEVVEYKNIAGYIGGFGLFFAASGLFSSMRTILNKIFKGEKEKHVLIAKLRDFAMVILVIVLVLSATIILPAIGILKELVNQLPILSFIKLSALEHFYISLISVIIIYVIFYVFYSLIPYAKIGNKVPAVSAFWATLLWEVAKRVFGYYITHFASITKIYGTYALIVVVAFWIYYSCLVFILGAEIGQLYRERLLIKRKP